MASMEFKAHHVGATKIGQQLNSSQTVCLYVCVRVLGERFLYLFEFVGIFFSYIEYNIHVGCHSATAYIIEYMIFNIDTLKGIYS